MQRSQTIHPQFRDTLPFPVICYFSDFTAFGLRETFEYRLAVTRDSYIDRYENLEEQRLKRYT